jgi:multicomponent Na+:H+ antiporter subunit G
MLRDVVVWVLVGAGVGLQLLSVAGVVLMRDALDRLHYAGASTLATACVVAAVLVQEGPSLIGLKALLLGAFVLVGAPVLTSATARAVHRRGEAER